MSNTWAVPIEVLKKRNGSAGAGVGRPICPACGVGHLQPYQVEISLSDAEGGWNGANYLQGWVARCDGNAIENEHHRALYVEAGEDPGDDWPEHPSCGFAMPMVAKTYYGRGPAIPGAVRATDQPIG